MMLAIKSVVKKLYIHKALKNSRRTSQHQWATLKKILALSNKTELGRKYEFKTIKSIDDYQRKVPIMHYDDISPYWDREAMGEKCVFLNKPPLYFVESSGTTGHKKLIPVTSYMLSATRKCQKIVVGIAFFRKPKNNFLSTKLLYVSSRFHMSNTDSGIPIAMISGVLYKTMSYFLKYRVKPSGNTVNCKDRIEKLQLYAKEVVGNKFGSIAGIPTSLIDLLTYLKNTLSEADYSYCFGDTNFLFCSGINYRPYKQKFYELLNEKIVFLDFYMASEGPFGCEAPENPDYFQFIPSYVFYEFIPFTNYLNDDYSQRLLLDQIEVNKQYAVAITSGTGTFSYINGDVIECCSTSPLRFKLTGRTHLTLSIAGEKTSITHVEKAIVVLCKSLYIKVKEFFVAENGHTEKPSYTWYLEETPELSNYKPDELAAKLDLALSSTNRLYDYFLNEIVTMDKSNVHFLPSEKFTRWFISRGSDPNHHKVPRIIVDQEVVSELMNA